MIATTTFDRTKEEKMKLLVYKGFSKDFLLNIKEKPLAENNIENKKRVLYFNDDLRRQMRLSLFSLGKNSEIWVTYEEFAFIKDEIDLAVKNDGLKIIVYVNNLLPGYYPIEDDLSDEFLKEIDLYSNSDKEKITSKECERFFKIYNSISIIDKTVFASFYNDEYGHGDVIEYFPNEININETKEDMLTVYLNDDIDGYLRSLFKIVELKPSQICYKSTNGVVSSRILESLKAFCLHNSINLFSKTEEISNESVDINTELKEIACKDIGIPNFKEFRTIKFYKNADKDNQTVNISQAQIVRDIITQAERAYNNEIYRDIFITASTGAGKSVMFQVPAVYLAKHYGKLTIIIEPVKALMQDQKEQLESRGFRRVEVFNSDLITQTEKEAVLKRIKSGDVDLLYLSPETLLSYSIETLIGDREIGLVIVDEAHIVTTWGVGFRPDYWYLGGYINLIRNGVQSKRKVDQKKQHFPICAFTATAICGGVDDTISDTVISLYMENPITYLGYVKRDNIGFEIIKREDNKIANSVYEKQKSEAFSERIKQFIDKKEKSIVYFPYAIYAHDAFNKIKSFSNASYDSKWIAVYTGKNTDYKSIEIVNREKKEAFQMFRRGTKPVMFATKAFGMGIDIDDIKNVYHYAVTGSLSDYVQEIGRAARRKDIKGMAITDYFYNDLLFIQRLWGMSQIRQYQIDLVLAQIYQIYRNKQGKQNFLISPGTFTYIFNDKEENAINKLKTCLLMLEKDLYDKYNFKVLISRPQSVFTKAFIVISDEHKEQVLNSKYKNSFEFLCEGRKNESIAGDNNRKISDLGDIYVINLKEIWEQFYPNLSFPEFKYLYFNIKNDDANQIKIMPEISQYIYHRQFISVKVNERKNKLLCELKPELLADFDYIAEQLQAFGRKYFTKMDFANSISKRFGKTLAQVISSSLFEIVDPDGKCIKHRISSESKGAEYIVSDGTIKDRMRRFIVKSGVINSFDYNHNTTFSKYSPMAADDFDSVALKLLALFDYITYEVVGGKEPEIFIRLNDPEKIRRITANEIKYSNDYVTKARNKHRRDVDILIKFFEKLSTDEQRWDYIEKYFLGYDVLAESSIEEGKVSVSSVIEVDKSYRNVQYSSWEEMANLFDEDIHDTIKNFEENDIPIPGYLETKIKKGIISGEIIMCWPDKNVIIFKDEISNKDSIMCKAKGWYGYNIYDIDINSLKNALS